MKIGIITNTPVLFTLSLAQILSKYDSVQINDSENNFGFMYESEDSADEMWYDIPINVTTENASFVLIVNPTVECDKYIAVFNPLLRDIDKFKKLIANKPEEAEMVFVTEFETPFTKFSEKIAINELGAKRDLYVSIPLNEHDVGINQSFTKEINATNLSADYQVALLVAFNFITGENVTRIRKISKLK